MKRYIKSSVDPIGPQTQFMVHSYDTESVVFRGTEQECIDYINSRPRDEELEVYWANPGDRWYRDTDEFDDIYSASEEEQRLMKRSSFRINYDIAIDILKNLSDSKKIQLDKMLSRNAALTSSYSCSFGTLRVYKQGWYLTLDGTRSSFSVWVYDEGGELVEGRKPNESTLDFLYEDPLNFNQLGESDWQSLTR